MTFSPAKMKNLHDHIIKSGKYEHEVVPESELSQPRSSIGNKSKRCPTWVFPYIIGVMITSLHPTDPQEKQLAQSISMVLSRLDGSVLVLVFRCDGTKPEERSHETVHK